MNKDFVLTIDTIVCCFQHTAIINDKTYLIILYHVVLDVPVKKGQFKEGLTLVHYPDVELLINLHVDD